jgi:hypothetical protein
VAHVRRYLVEGIVPTTCVSSRMAAPRETPDLGLPDRTMAAHNGVLPAGEHRFWSRQWLKVVLRWGVHMSRPRWQVSAAWCSDDAL